MIYPSVYPLLVLNVNLIYLGSGRDIYRSDLSYDFYFAQFSQIDYDVAGDEINKIHSLIYRRYGNQVYEYGFSSVDELLRLKNAVPFHSYLIGLRLAEDQGLIL